MAAKFWVGGGSTTNWNATAPTNWAATSGGAGNQPVPSAGDDVTFDNNSGTGASIWNTTISLNSLICTNSRNLVTHNNGVNLTISGGNLALPGGVGATYTANSATAIFTITGTTGTQTITSSGKNLGGLTLNGVGGTFQLQDNLNCSAFVTSTITLSNGTFDCQTFTVTTGLFANGVGNVRTLKGSGLWTVGALNATGNIWNTTATNLTSTNFTSSVTVTGTTGTTRNFIGGGLTTYGTLTVDANTSGGVLVISGNNTFAAFSPSAPNAIVNTAGATQTITAAPTITGTPTAPIAFLSGTLGSAATWSVAAGTVTFTWNTFRDSSFTGGATFTANNSLDSGKNTGITINPPSGGPVGQQCM